MKIGGLKKYLEVLHKDRMFITRPEKIKDPDGSSRVIIPDTPKYSDVPCRISFGTYSDADNPNSQTDVNNPIFQQITIFCDPAVDVKKGDKLLLQKMDDDGNIVETYEGMTGNRPNTYNLNKMILFTQTGDA